MKKKAPLSIVSEKEWGYYDGFRFLYSKWLLTSAFGRRSWWPIIGGLPSAAVELFQQMQALFAAVIEESGVDLGAVQEVLHGLLG